MKQLVLVLGAVFLLGGHSAVQAGDHWREWRGETGQGVSSAKRLPASWSETDNIGWKVRIPGHGWSTPVIDNGQVWVTTAIDKPASKADAERRRKASTNSQPLTISESVSLRAVCVDLKSGKLLHNIELMNVKNPQEIHILNTYATPSPIIEKGRLYCHFGASGMACLDIKTGKVAWRNTDLSVKLENGPGSSPILWKNLLIVHCDGIDQQYITAIDKRTGQPAWKTKRSGELKKNPQLRKAYATSLIVDVDGKPQVISPAADWVYGYDPATGRELWKLNYGTLGFSNAPRPIAANGLIYTCTGYMKSQMMAIRVGKTGVGTAPKIAWRHTRKVPNVSSPLIVGSEMYFVSDDGVVTCLDAQSGKVHWVNRIGGKHWASPLAADGKIYFSSREGQTTVIAAGKKFRKLADNKLDGKIFASSAAVDGALILRTDSSLYRINGSAAERD